MVYLLFGASVATHTETNNVELKKKKKKIVHQKLAFTQKTSKYVPFKNKPLS